MAVTYRNVHVIIVSALETQTLTAQQFALAILLSENKRDRSNFTTMCV